MKANSIISRAKIDRFVAYEVGPRNKKSTIHEITRNHADKNHFRSLQFRDRFTSNRISLLKLEHDPSEKNV